jgi:hypothetical protein
VLAALSAVSFIATALPAVASAPKKNGRYLGETSQLRTIQVQVSRSGERVADPSFVTVDLICPKGRQAFGTFRPTGAKIRAGKFSFEGTHKLGSYRYAATMTGSFERRGRYLDGTLTLRRVGPRGTVCRSGQVTYTARARRG